MHLNLEFWSDLKLSKFSKKELRLLDRLRLALKQVDLSAELRLGGAYEKKRYVAEALIHSASPITLDFRAYQVGDDIGQAFFTDKTPLSNSLFAGDAFSGEVLAKHTEHWEYFKATIQKPEKPVRYSAVQAARELVIAAEKVPLFGKKRS